MCTKLSMSVARFVVQYRIAILLKRTLLIKFPAIRFHILTSLKVGGASPFRLAILRFEKTPNIFGNFFKNFFKQTKCARQQGADGRKGNVSSI